MPALPSITAFAASPPPWSLASLDTNFTNVATLLKSANNYSLYLADAGSANAYAVSFAAGVTWTLAAGAVVLVNPANSNTTASTLSVNSGTAKNIFKAGAALVGGEISAGVPFWAVYDGTQYQMINQGFQTINNTLSGDVTLTTQNTYYDGPSCAQGTAGIWLATGSVVVQTSGIGADALVAKLWDGTTAKASGKVDEVGASKNSVIALSGVFTAPAANIRISASNQSNNGGLIKFNATGASADATLTVIRLA